VKDATRTELLFEFRILGIIGIFRLLLGVEDPLTESKRFTGLLAAGMNPPGGDAAPLRSPIPLQP
jgi:hypothetical protein